MTKIILLAFLFPALVSAQENEAQSLANDFDSLGGNSVFLEKAKALHPETENIVIQPRTVSRRNRFEISPEFSGTFGGDTYSRTQTAAMNIHFHINPRWSVGAKFGYSVNQLTPEGSAMVDRAYDDYKKNPKNPSYPMPQMDYQKAEAIGLVNFYPIYGKLNLLDRSVAQFDTYMVLGGGTVNLKSGATPTGILGAGVALWLNPKLSTRLEMRYQNYKAEYITGRQNLNLAVASIQVGWLL